MREINEAICTKCLKQEQHDLMDGPRPQESIEIYDAHVVMEARIRNDLLFK
jgi:hypothetical protein